MLSAATSVVLRRTARLGVRSAAVWGAAFGALIANEALSYHRGFPTIAARQAFAHSFADNAGLAAVTGRPYQLDTVNGFVAWRIFGLLIVAGAVWGLLTATRLTRAEEESGRWDLLLSGQTSRRRAARQALGGLATAYAGLLGPTAVCTVAAGTRSTVGFSVGESLFYAVAATSSAAMFLAVGAAAAQLTTTRRGANGLALAVLGYAFLARLVADAADGFGWLRWASPLGWVENLRPLTQPQPWAFVPIILLIAATVGAVPVLADRRDVGRGLLARANPAPASLRLLSGPFALAVRLERLVAVSWLLTIGLLAVVFGVVAGSAARANLGDQSVRAVVGPSAAGRGAAAAWIAYELMYLAALIAFAVVNQVAAMQEEETSGHLDHVVSGRYSRQRWLTGRLALAGALAASSGLAAGLGAWCGLRGTPHGPGLAALLAAGLNISVPALLVLGVGALLYGLRPRHAAAALQCVVLWSLLVEVLGTSLTDNRLVLDLSVLAPLTPAPAVSPDLPRLVLVVLAAALATGLGLTAFGRRDLAPA